MLQHKTPKPENNEVVPSLVFIALYLICLIHALLQTGRGDEIKHVHYTATPQYKNPCPRDHEIKNFGGPFLEHYYFTLSLSDLCLGVEKYIFEEIMYFHYITYMATPQHKNPYPGVMKFTILVDPSSVIITINLDGLFYAQELRRRFLKK